MVKFISENRQGKEIRLDLRIGYLHAFPNGELQFENIQKNVINEIDTEVQKIN